MEKNPCLRCRLSVSMNEEESARLFSAWKHAEGVKNCTQYVKAAVNAYAGETIFNIEEKKA